MADFFTNPICTERIHCQACRTRKEFRERIAETFEVSGVDFDCPVGITAEDFEDDKLPSMVKAAQTAARAMLRVAGAAIKGDPVRVSDNEQARRLAICQGSDNGATIPPCMFYLPEGGTCKKCRCGVELKTMLATEHCPIEKW